MFNSKLPMANMPPPKSDITLFEQGYNDLVTVVKKQKRIMIIKAYAYVNDLQDAQEALQEACLAIITSLKKAPRPIHDMEHYLGQTVRNKALKIARDKKRYSTIDLPENETLVITRTETKERMEVPYLLKSIQSLLSDSQYRAIFLWAHGYSYADIADDLERSITSVRGLLDNAKKKLKKNWDLPSL